MEVTEVFANRLRELREASGLNQSQLAEKLGVSRGSISYYENQDRTPDIVFLKKASTFFGVSYNYLLGSSCNKYENNEEIGERIGLTDEAIEVLEFLHKLEQGNPYINVSDILSKIIVNERFSLMLYGISLLTKNSEDPSASDGSQVPDSITQLIVTSTAALILNDLNKAANPDRDWLKDTADLASFLYGDFHTSVNKFEKLIKNSRIKLMQKVKEGEENGDNTAKKE